ncbi:MFS general substrate transporter [Guyanagaster necrorhizus]|uniref:MFS general substrate transporter n=1 Tax=Guyanagaster necrorhizus TaxID=856835 RepID=A0A9P7VS60_9AGAR|nr:MFS general substrate transporter [Guyanagaster necrorhizus MCA 3950]KAG7445485.1 MFS general substrate transporter [Guyanagaster necrorhizus MCA 3950]
MDAPQDSQHTKYTDSEKSQLSLELDARSSRRLWFKMDFFILPVVGAFYSLSMLDRTSIGNAQVAGLQTDLKMTNTQYSIALTVTYIPYIVVDLPSNLLLRVIGPNYLLPTTVVLWGVVTALQGLVKSYSGLLACRFFLGLLEGGIFPGLVLYLSHFYPRVKMTTRVSAMYAFASITGSFAGILAFGISQMHGKLGHSGWQWIFIIEGCFTIFGGIVNGLLMPRDPMSANFLRPEEREYVASQVSESGGEKFEWREVRKAFLTPHVWILSVVFFFSGILLFGLAYFTPSIVQSLGYSSARSNLMSVPPFAVAFAVSLGTSYLCDRFHIRGLVCIISSIVSMIGFIVFLKSTAHDTRYGSLFLSIPGAFTSAPTLAAWNAANSEPHVRRATTIAIGVMMTSAGGILSTWLLGSLSAAPDYTLGTRAMIAFSAAMAMGSAVCLGYFKWMNQRKKTVLGRGVNRSVGHVENTDYNF